MLVQSGREEHPLPLLLTRDESEQKVPGVSVVTSRSSMDAFEGRSGRKENPK